MEVDRRSFLKFIAGAGAGIMVTPLPWKLLDDVSIWSQNWGWIPRLKNGETTYLHAVSKTCPSAVAMKVRMVGDRAVRVLPNPEHPLGGGISAIAAAEVQMLCSPGRVQTPMLRGSDGGFRQISWAEAGKMFFEQLNKAKNKTAFITGDETGSSLEVISAFAAKLGSNSVFLMPSEAQAAAGAAALMGIDAQFGYDFEQSDYVLAVGANILDTWGTAIRNRRIFSKTHPHPAEGSKNTATIAYAGPLQNNTAAVAKPWLPIAPNSECYFLLAVCAELIKRGRTVDAGDFSAFRDLAITWSPETAEAKTGLPAKKITETVDALLAAKHPLVVAASNGQGAAPLALAFAANSLLGVINTPGGMTLLPDAPTVVSGAKQRKEVFKNDVMAFLAGNKLPELLVVHEANPVYALPKQNTIRENLKKIPFKVAYSTFMDETAMLCDLVLPIPMGLESTDDLCSPYGCGKTTYCLTTAASQPMENAIGIANTLLFLARQMKNPLGYEFFADVLKAKASKLGANFDVLAAGSPLVNENTVTPGWIRLRPDVIGAALKQSAEATSGKGLALAVYSKLNMGTAKTGIPPFNTKTIRVQDLTGSEMYVMMNGKTAQKHGLAADDRLMVSRDGKKSIPARLRIFEGLTHDTVAVCTGFGHSALDAFSRNKGANIMELMDAAAEPETGLSTWAFTRVNVSKA